MEPFICVPPSSLFLKSMRENMIAMILCSSTLGTQTLFLVCGSSPRLSNCNFSSYPIWAEYVEVMGKEKGYNSSHVYYQAKGWSKNS
jgi:hypothetical protein